MAGHKNLEIYIWECQSAKGNIMDHSRIFEKEEMISHLIENHSGHIRIMAESLKEAELKLLSKVPNIYEDSRDIRFAGTIPLSSIPSLTFEQFPP